MNKLYLCVGAASLASCATVQEGQDYVCAHKQEIVQTIDAVCPFKVPVTITPAGTPAPGQNSSI